MTEKQKRALIILVLAIGIAVLAFFLFKKDAKAAPVKEPPAPPPPPNKLPKVLVPSKKHTVAKPKPPKIPTSAFKDLGRLLGNVFAGEPTVTGRPSTPGGRVTLKDPCGQGQVFDPVVGRCVGEDTPVQFTPEELEILNSA